ncbi:hypothetical protein [Pirellulimonas nuda]|uniref:hypothetical protein n=1 Tax=Pirellulimonas nuda TaxID=2528009 RepID=UPI0011AAEDFC|nr:hypothetical protein [Pirellulimonas nuda]
MLCVCALAVLTPAAQGVAQDFSQVPGTVVNHFPRSSGEYVGSPSIVILPNGDYVASHDRFGPSSSFNTSSKTEVFRSTDQGLTWSPSATLQGQAWSNLFTQGNDLYIMGVDKLYGRIVVRKSIDGGSSWTNPTNAANGFLTSANGYHTAPMPMVEHNGRIWRGFEDTSNGGGWPRHFRSLVMSAPIGSDLLVASNWTLSNALASNTSWINGEVNGWLEGGVVVDRDDNLVNLLRVDNLSVAAVVRVDEQNHSVSFNPDQDFVDFPGGATKFAVRYDAASDRYWTLSNPVLPQFQGSSPGSTRNALALMSSSDLSDWEVESVLLYHPDRSKHGFQYVDWQFDGQDLIAASRTAYDDGLGGAANYHDANFLTFHRADDFRTLSPSHALVADTGADRILRYQANAAGEWVPLGNFINSNAPGAALDAPIGLLQDSQGFVYVGEQKDGGRIIRFDAGGNFIDVVATEGVDFSGRPEALALGPDGNLILSTAFGADSDRIFSIDTASRAVATLVDTAFAGGSLDNPRGIAVDDAGTLYVANREGDKVQKFNATTGAFLGDLWSIDSPQGLAWDTSGQRLIASALSSTDLYEVSPDGVANKLYDPSDIGSALGIQVIDGEAFWTDFQNGRVYRLTAQDQKETVVSGLSGPGHVLGVAAPQERTWLSDGIGVWRDPTNWSSYWGVANTAEEIAVFGPGMTADRTVVLDQDVSVGGVRLIGENSVAIAGPGVLRLAGVPVQVFGGDHQLQVAVSLLNEVRADISAGASLAVNNQLRLGGHDLRKTGEGELTLNGEVVADGGEVLLEQGTLNGSGAVLGGLSNTGGTLSPGNSPGRLSISGDYTQGQRGALVMELGGTDANRYDQLLVQGLFTAGGLLSVELIDGYTPALGDFFELVSFRESRSNFSSIDLPRLDNGLAWRLSLHSQPGVLQLSVVAVPEPSAYALSAALLGALFYPTQHIPTLRRLTFPRGKIPGRTIFSGGRR